MLLDAIDEVSSPETTREIVWVIGERHDVCNTVSRGEKFSFDRDRIFGIHL